MLRLQRRKQGQDDSRACDSFQTLTRRSGEGEMRMISQGVQY